MKSLVRFREELRRGEHSSFKLLVPSASGEEVVVTRKTSKVLNLLDDAITRDLHQQSLITAVSVLEEYVFSTAKIILRWYPEKLKTNMAGVATERKFDIDLLLQSENLDSLLTRVVERQLLMVSYDSPDRYLQYIERALSITLPEETKNKYCEIKTTRDILVHNQGIVNSVYLKKAGGLARAKEGDLLPVDSNYFDEAIRCMKRLTNKIYKQCLGKYGNAETPLPKQD